MRIIYLNSELTVCITGNGSLCDQFGRFLSPWVMRHKLLAQTALNAALDSEPEWCGCLVDQLALEAFFMVSLLPGPVRVLDADSVRPVPAA